MTDKNKIEDEIQFTKLLKSPIRLFGWIYPYFLVVIFVIGLFYVKNLDRISFNEVPPAIEETSIPELEMKRGGITLPVDLAIISAPTAEFLAKGKELYKLNCLSCHGENGLGDGPAGLPMNPKPRNFHETDGWTNGRTFSDLYRTLEEGILKNGMASYEILPPEERIAIIHYVRSFAEFPGIGEDEIGTLDITYELSKGRRTPNRIPVNLAISSIVKESSAQIGKAAYLVRYFVNHPDEPGASLLESKSHDVKKTLAVLGALDGTISKGVFISKISATPIELGFKAEISNLTADEWQLLYLYFGKLSALTI